MTKQEKMNRLKMMLETIHRIDPQIFNDLVTVAKIVDIKDTRKEKLKKLGWLKQ